MGIKKMLKKAGGKAADTVARLSVLSPEQLRDVESQREAYLSEAPSLDDQAAELITRRLLGASSIEIYNEYLKHLNEFYVPVRKDAEYNASFNSSYNIRYINITKWVTDKKENTLEKLVNVYEVLSDEDCNIALVFHRTMMRTSVYLAVTNTQNANNNVDIDNYMNRLMEAIRGNFPGVEWVNETGKGILPCLKDLRPYTVASASNLPGEKSEKFVSQTIEKLLDGVIPDDPEKEYTMILLATPVKDVEERKLHLADIYTAMAPYAGWQTDFTYTQSDSTNSMATFGLNAGISAGIQNGRNSAISDTHGTTDSDSSTSTNSTGTTDTHSEGNSISDTTSTTESHGTSDSISETTGSTSSTGTAHSIGTNESSAKAATNSVGIGASGGIDKLNINGSLSHSEGLTNTVGSSVNDTISDTLSEMSSNSVGKTITDTVANTIGKTVAKSTGKAIANSVSHAVADTLGRAVTKSNTISNGIYKGVNLGGNFGANFARSSNVSASVGKNEGITQSFTNYTIKHTLEILEEQMKRLEQSTALGMWDFAAYFLSEDLNVASNVAHSYLALTQGEKSYMSQTAVNVWRGDTTDSDEAKEIYEYLRELRHHIFGLSPAITTLDMDFNTYPAIVTATTSLSGKELAYSLNFPGKSVAGFPVISCAEFGRNVVTYKGHDKDGLHIGNIFHMNHEESEGVSLTKDSLASHVFITGSTGSGKSNTVYQILEKVKENNVKFLVIEPSKGEYKHVFGNQDNVSVYGTNPVLSPLLRINPFSFPKGVHIFEHLERLVEIFNVCWPMYAAMPVVLKTAIQKSYEDCGWDMLRSVNVYSSNLYPTFKDVARNIKKIIEASEYDTDNKGAYKGSLLTRLESLTNGINGMVFVTNEIDAADLFDQNVIIDLSRVGSSETKSLIMGMLVLKLQEYRMSSVKEINSNLKHVTVLEEAHTILKKTSSSVTSESTNILAKSVEMISNAIAEMRTYGEGFIIVDQAPGLLDMAAIRNTNTKIIMRLPDQEDRELVGKAANLNEDQIQELAKLPCGVAAIYQNEWVQPVLCKIFRYDTENEIYSYTQDKDVFQTMNTTILAQSLLDCLLNQNFLKLTENHEISTLCDEVIKSAISTDIKLNFIRYISSESDEKNRYLGSLLYDLLHADKAIEQATGYDELSLWRRVVVEHLIPSIKQYSNAQINFILGLLLREQTERHKDYTDLYCRFTEIYKIEGRGI